MGFLDYYINPTKETLDPDRTYPLGQKMFISAYNVDEEKVQRMYDSGFTAAGPWENAWPSSNHMLKKAILKVNELGMRASLQIRGGSIGEACNYMNDGDSYEQTFDRYNGRTIMNNMYGTNPSEAWKGEAEGQYGPTTEIGDPLYYRVCDVWESHPEEMASRTNTCPNDPYGCCSAGIAKGVGYAQYIRDYINGWDSAGHKISQLRTENWNAWSSSFRTRHVQVNGWMSTVVPQIRAYGTGTPTDIPVMLNRAIPTFNNLEADSPLASGLPRALAVNTLASDITGYTAADAELDAFYSVFFCIARGVTHINFYQNLSGHMATYIYEAIKILTSYNFDEAFMWGTPDPSIKLSVSLKSGSPTTYDATHGTVDTLVWAQRQYKNERFLVITNSHETSSISVTISNLPTGLILRNCRDDTTITLNSSTKDITLTKLAVAIYKIENMLTVSPSGRYWKVNDQYKLLAGGTWGGEPHLYEQRYSGNGISIWDNSDFLGSELNKIAGVRGNYFRCTLLENFSSPYVIGKGNLNQSVFPFNGSPGNFDLRYIRQNWVDRVDALLYRCADKGIVVQLEIFDSWWAPKSNWTHSYMWWNPSNVNYPANYTYNNTGLPVDGQSDSDNGGYANYHFTNPARTNSNSNPLLIAQKLIVNKICDIVKRHDNCFLQIQNESFEQIAWEDYWCNYIKGQGVTTPITSMLVGHALTGDDAHAMSNSIYDFGESSQQWWTCTNRDTEWTKLQNFYSYGNKPVNTEKIYSSWDSNPGYHSEAIDYMFLSFMAGNAACAFHPGSGEIGSGSLGTSPRALKAMYAADWLNDNCDIFNMGPISSANWGGSRSAESAYATKNSEYIAIYLTGSNNNLTFDTTGLASPLLIEKWISVDTNSINEKSNTRSTITPVVNPFNGNKAIVIFSISDAPPVVGNATRDKAIYEVGDTTNITATDDGAVSRKWWFKRPADSGWSESSASGNTTNTITFTMGETDHKTQFRLTSTNDIGSTDGEAVTLYIGTTVESSGRYWKINDQYKLLIGGTNAGEPNLYEQIYNKNGITLNDNTDFLGDELTKISNAGGNYFRCTLASWHPPYATGAMKISYPFPGYPNNFDLTQINQNYFDRLDAFLYRCEALGIVPQLEIWDTWWNIRSESVWEGDGTVPHHHANAEYNPAHVTSPTNYTTGNTGLTTSHTPNTNDKFTAPALANSESNPLLIAQKLYVAAVCEVIKRHPNCLVEIQNESIESTDWGDYWTSYIQGRGVTAPITEMQNSQDITVSIAKHAMNNSQYKFGDNSQGTRSMGPAADQGNTDNLFNNAINFMGAGSKPANATKIYRYKPKNTAITIDKMFTLFMAGNAGVAFHPGDGTDSYSGVGVVEEALKAFTAADWLDKNCTMYNMNAVSLTSGSWNGSRTTTSAYATKNSEYIAIYLTGSNNNLTFDTTGLASSLLIEKWISVDTNSINEKSNTRSTTTPVVNPFNGNKAIVIFSVSNAPLPVVGKATRDKDIYEVGDTANITATDDGEISRKWWFKRPADSVWSESGASGNTTNTITFTMGETDHKTQFRLTSTNDIGSTDGEAVTLYIGTTVEPSGRYWKINDQYKLLIGGTNGGEPHLYEQQYNKYGIVLNDDNDYLGSELTKISDAGGNYFRCTLVNWSPPFVPYSQHLPYPFMGSLGAWDLTTLNQEYFDRLDALLYRCEALGIVVQLELFDPWWLMILEGVWEADGTLTPHYIDNYWNPARNITYTEAESGLPEDWYTIIDHRSDEFTAPMRNNLESNKLLIAQKLWVNKVCSIAKAHGNTLIQIENECPELIDWDRKWTDYIHTNHPGLIVSTMRGPFAENHEMMTDSRYDFADSSQQNWDTDLDLMFGDLTTLHSKGSKPVNAVKIYESPDGDIPITIHKMMMAFMVGNAGCAFHPGDGTANYSGIGTIPEAVRAFTAGDWLDKNCTMYNMDTVSLTSSAWGGSRSANSAYACENDSYIAIYLTGSNNNFTFDTSAMTISPVKEKWINVDTGVTTAEQTISRSPTTPITNPFGSAKAIVIFGPEDSDDGGPIDPPINPPIVGPAIPDVQSKHVGEVVSFTATDENETSRRWQSLPLGGSWSNSDLPGSTSNMITFTAEVAQDGTQYRLSSTNTRGTRYGDPGSLFVTVGPPIVDQATPSIQSVMAGGLAIFTALDIYETTRRWQVLQPGESDWNECNYPCNTSNTIVVSPLTQSNHGQQFRLASTNSVGTTFGGAAVLNITVPSQKVKNGTFDSDTANWENTDSILSVDNGELKVNNITFLKGQARQVVSVVQGEVYALRWKHGAGSTHGAEVMISSSGYTQSDVYLGNSSHAARGKTYSDTIISTTNEMYITLYTDAIDQSADWDFTLFDNISIIGQ